MEIKEIKEIKDGKVIAIDADDQETSIDVGETLSKLSSVNSESASRRIRIKELEEELNGYKEKAKELEGKIVADPIEIESKNEQVVNGYKEKVASLSTAIEEKDSLIRKLTIGSKFTTSDYINKKTILTPDIAESYFSKFFSVNDQGEIVAKRKDGSTIFDKDDPEKFASFDDAISVLVEEMQNKDKILLAPATGDGMKGGNITGDYSLSHIKSFKDFKSTSERTEYIKKFGLEAFKKLAR